MTETTPSPLGNVIKIVPHWNHPRMGYLARLLALICRHVDNGTGPSSCLSRRIVGSGHTLGMVGRRRIRWSDLLWSRHNLPPRSSREAHAQAGLSERRCQKPT
jgi:hypothetical protein